jgi:hypothetical protein
MSVKVASAIIFWQAKKHSWEVRKSIRRASRRMTGNFNSKTRGQSKGQRKERRVRGVSRIEEVDEPMSTNFSKDVEKGTKKKSSTMEMKESRPKFAKDEAKY